MSSDLMTLVLADRATTLAATVEVGEIVAADREPLAAAYLDVERVLSRAEHDLLDAALDPAVPAERLIALSARRRRHGTPATLVPRDLRQTFAREAPLRFMAAAVLIQR